VLGDLAGIHRCLYTGFNEAYVVNDEIIRKQNLERELVKPVLRGEDVRRWNISWCGLYVIYPYRKINGKLVKASIKEYPNIEKYLREFKRRLMSRWYIEKVVDDKTREEKWFEYADPRNFEQFENVKILTPDISTRNNFVLDSKGYYCLNVIYAINPDTGKVNSEYLLGTLNSQLLEFYFKHISPFISGGYYRYITQYLERLPIRLPKTPKEETISENVARSVREILQLCQQNHFIKERIRRFPESYFENNLSFDRLANVGIVRLSKSSYDISAKTIKTYPFKELEYPFREVSRIILATEEHIDFYSEEIASYVLMVLKNLNKITKRELLELKIPQQLHLKNLLSQYRKDKEQIVKNEKAIEESEKQIDDLIYKLCSISYAERRIVEDYLKKS
jgi:hypothetical protein